MKGRNVRNLEPHLGDFYKEIKGLKFKDQRRSNMENNRNFKKMFK